MSTPSPKQLADELEDLARKLHSSGGRALEYAVVLAARGYPASVTGNGSRSSDTTTSVERAVGLAGDDGDLTPMDAEWFGIDTKLRSELQLLQSVGLAVEATINKVLKHGTTNDVLPPGTGECTCGDNCGPDRKTPTFCSPRNNGPHDRLVSGLAPTCYRRFARWRETHPDGTVVEWKHATRRAREIADEQAARLAAGRAALRA